MVIKGWNGNERKNIHSLQIIYAMTTVVNSGMPLLLYASYTLSTD